MKTNAWRPALVALACTLFAGCDFDVPLTRAATHPVNPQLLGNWRQQGDNPERLSIRRLDATTYLVAYDGDLYRAFHSETAGREFVSVQNLNDDDRKYCYYTWALSHEGEELTLRRLNPHLTREAIASPEAAQRLVAENLTNPKLLEEPATFLREKR